MSSNVMATVTCWAVLLLTVFPSPALGGRHIPAGALTQTASGVVVVQVVPASRHVIGRGRALGVIAGTKDSTPPSSHRKVLVGFKHMKAADSIYGHRLLVGSSPPTCQGKCGACSPCNPIHVSIGSPHGALTQQEYYPEVWRCKCGNKLFMP